MESASSHLDLLDLLNEKQLSYIKEGGSSDSYQFKRTCVLDSLLAAFHTTFMKYLNVKAYLNSDKQFRELMALLSAKKYVEAKDLCVPKLKHVEVDDTRKEKDFYGSVYDHFLLFDKLVCETISNPKPLKDSLIYKETLSFVKALGDPADPTLILGCCSTPKPLLHVEDEKKRIFALQFLLIGKNDHMTMCFQSYKNKWHLYDNDTTKPPFEPFDLESLKDLNDICLAGYVNITQAQGYKLAVPETGEAAGAKPFYSGASSSIHLDPGQSVEDLCCASSDSVAIPETGEGLGPKPLYQNQPYSPTFSNQEQLVEDIEMPSCSSSDSDGEGEARSLMASIVSSLDNEKELRLQRFFSSPVRFHLLYKSSHHGATISELLSSFDTCGKFLLAVFLQSGSVRGAFMSQSLKYGGEFSDTEAFVFEMDEHSAEQFLVINPAKAVEVRIQNTGYHKGLHASSKNQSASISFGNCITLDSDNSRMYVSFCTDVTYGTTWPQENNICCVDVELHRVQDVVSFLPTPWREVSWTDTTRESLRQEFVSYKLPTKYPVSRVKVLLLGPVGSGKSCFINSIRSTMYRRIVHLPNVGTAVNGFTKKLNIYDILGEKRGSPTVLNLCDVMALGDDDSTGLSFSDALAVIKGHVPKGYKFQPDVPVTDAVSGYKANPSLNEQVHCVLFVLDAFKLTSYPSSLKSTLRKLNTTISDLGIPQLILLTHVDRVCPAVQEDLKYVYSSRTVQDKMQKAAELVGLPLSYVLPVKNYVAQLTVDYMTDILLLSVVMSILQSVDDTLEDQYPSTPTCSPVDLNLVEKNVVSI